LPGNLFPAVGSAPRLQAGFAAARSDLTFELLRCLVFAQCPQEDGEVVR
jgi:hypothetical protein